MHRLGVLAQLVQHYPQQMARGVFHIGVLRAVLDQIAQLRLGFRILLSAMQQECPEIPRLIVARMLRPTGLDTFPRLLQPALFLKPNRQIDAGIDAISIDGHGALVTTAGIVQLAQALVLLADHAEQRDLARRQLQRAAVGKVGLGKIQFPGSGVAQLEPQFRHGGIPPHQLAVGRQGGAVLAAEQFLLSLLPASDITRRPFQLGQCAAHSSK